MTPPVFVVPVAHLAPAVVGGTIRLDGTEGRHAVTVRRLEPGEAVHLVDGAGRRVDGVVTAVLDKQTMDVQVEACIDEPVPAPRIVVVQALPKGDRGELAVELLTEIGVDEIVPWAAATCVTQWKGERAERSHRRWADAAHAAAKQARRARFPVIARLATTAEVVERLTSAARALVLHEDATTPIGSVALPADGEVVLVVGPEGGITSTEQEAFAAAGASLVRLGPDVLRTSSAGLAAVAALCARSPRWAIADGAGMEG